MNITDFYKMKTSEPYWIWYPMDVDKEFWPNDGDKIIVANKRKIGNSNRYTYDYCVATAIVNDSFFTFNILGSKKYKNIVKWTKICDNEVNNEENKNEN